MLENRSMERRNGMITGLNSMGMEISLGVVRTVSLADEHRHFT